jgi:subtilase family serine protease
MRTPSRRPFRACFEPLENRSLLSIFTPSQLQHAYGVDTIRFRAGGKIVPGDGTGQTIAIVVAYHNPFLTQEVAGFNNTYGLPSTNLAQVNLAGALTNSGWAEEEAMDVEWAHAIAPGASILVVEARSDSVSDLMVAVDYARNTPGVSVVSMSWGSGEFRGQTNYNPIFSTPAGHTGVTFVAASGDYGARYGASWPASSPNVVAVGGTTLYTDAAGNNLGEAAWADSGGGYSRIATEPSYQYALQRTGRRSTPDVSMLADPATGVGIFVVSPVTGAPYWTVVGGTSLSTQLFGAVVSIANQGRALSGLGTLDSGTQTLPALYAVSSIDFQDVVYGSNGYLARGSYDLATGRGSPKAALLVADLANFTSAIPTRTPFTRVRPRRALRAALGGMRLTRATSTSSNVTSHRSMRGPASTPTRIRAGLLAARQSPADKPLLTRAGSIA